MLAEAISGYDDYHFVHGAGFTGLNVQGFPYIHPKVSLYLKLVREQRDADGVHVLKVDLLDSRGQLLGVIAESQIELPGEVEGGDPLVITYVGHCGGLQFPQPGIYRVSLSLDGDELDRLSVAVSDHSQRAPA
jgi:hypothetical protein